MNLHFDDLTPDKISEILQQLLQDSGQMAWQHLLTQTRDTYDKLSDSLDNEFLIPLSEQQVNEALDKFVTKNVEAILDLHMEIHEGWLRLYATIFYQGIYAEVATNLSLIHIQLDRNVQRFVFGQLTPTDIISLQCEMYLKKVGIEMALWCYQKVMKDDPLGFILSKINIATPKDNVLYLDIHRWLKKNKKIMGYLQKVQVNHGFLAEQQLVLKANVNISEIISLGSDKVIITEADNPSAATTEKIATSD